MANTGRNSAITAKRVLMIESQAIQKMSENLPSDFVAVINKMFQTSGRIIVSGIGKSGHIGNKIASTFASTGTPAYFVHAAEASHGDLGMIAEDDFCLLISNSGETPELRNIVTHTRRFSIPMAGISSAPDSTLMKAADYKLVLPKSPEACSIGMAPTTSTTLTLALGDALAVALMEQRNFKAENFEIFHPGGKLGARLTTVKQLMHVGDQLPLVDGNLPMPETLLEMTSKGFGVAAVIENSVLTGIISDGDLRRHMAVLMEKKAKDIASPNPITVVKDQFAMEALHIMNTNKINALIVCDEHNFPVGILHIHDLLRAGVA